MKFLKHISGAFKGEITSLQISYIASILTFLLFHLPFFRFVFDNLDYKSFSGIILIVCLIVVMLVANAWVYYTLIRISKIFGKIMLIIFFIANSISLYFINTYSVILDESMMGNLINTNTTEATSYFSWKFVWYIVLFGLIPSIYIVTVKIKQEPLKRFFRNFLISLGFILIMIFANATNWLWIDKHSKQLGGLALPWSYMVNIPRYYTHQYQRNKKEILLPKATIKDINKAVVILVIGESARRENFSLYGYTKETNPLLQQIDGLRHYTAASCATYTTAGVKCILEHEETSDLYEILPNYLFRNGVDVVWRSTNWGEPPLHISKQQHRETLLEMYNGENSEYDEILLANLRGEITKSSSDKVLIILHTSTSHGPSYNKKYPPQFETFSPVCQSVELSKCSNEELINAYDNTIVYTDYLLSNIIDTLKTLPEYNSAMIFVSDHGESLGEKNLYMHGVPMSIAPKEQYEIPFIVWSSTTEKQPKDLPSASQHNVFHSVMDFLSIDSEIYKEEMSIFE